jgi:hypothetical protein
MKRFPVLFLVVMAFALGMYVARTHPAAAVAASINPTQGYTIHIDAEKHFGAANSTEVAHHWCKPVSGGMLECMIFDGDAADARLVEVETIVKPGVYKTFSPKEQALWHYHKVEIPKVNAKMPDATAEETKATVASLTETYGKVFMLWDPAANKNPIGQPTIVVLK